MPLKDDWVDGDSYITSAVNAVATAINAFGTAPSGAVVGTTDTQTLTNKTLTSPKVNQIVDSNGNELLTLAASGTAVNNLQINNGDTGSAPAIYAVGDDSDIAIEMRAKNNGDINLMNNVGTFVLQCANNASAVNYPYTENASAGFGAAYGVWGNDTDVDLNLKTKNAGVVKANGVEVPTISGTQTLTNKTVNLTSNTVTGTTAQFNTALSDNDFATLAGSETLTNKTLTSPSVGGTPVFTTGIPAANLPNGLTNGNTSAQSQIVVSGTSYYIAGSNLNLPATLKAGMAVGTRFRWRVAMAKTNAGTGAFAIEIRRGTAGTVADTADVSQSIGIQTAVVDSMVVDVEMVVTTTGATGAYFWSIIPVNKALTAAGFGVATGATGQFSGTVSSVAMNTASLIFGLSFKATTGTPTITVPLVRASALNIS